MPNNAITTFVFNRNITKKEQNYIKEKLFNDRNEIDFNKIIPQPDNLLRVNLGKDTVKQYSYYIELNPDNLNDKEIKKIINGEDITKNEIKIDEYHIASFYNNLSDEKKEEVKEKYISWYDWNIRNWGTKWNAYYTSLNKKMLSFNSAWCTPSHEIMEYILKTLKSFLKEEGMDKLIVEILSEFDFTIKQFRYNNSTNALEFYKEIDLLNEENEE